MDERTCIDEDAANVDCTHSCGVVQWLGVRIALGTRPCSFATEQTACVHMPHASSEM